MPPDDPTIRVMRASTLPADPARLTAEERAQLDALPGPRRRDEWIRGRLAIHRVLGVPGASILVDPDGAPRVVGADRSVSLAHDGDWIAVAVGDAGARIGVDLCVRQHAGRIGRILRWLDARTTGDPVACWAAIEATLKVQRLGVEALRDRAIIVEDDRGAACVVRGIGDATSVRTSRHRAFVVAWARGTA